MLLELQVFHAGGKSGLKPIRMNGVMNKSDVYEWLSEFNVHIFAH